MQECKVENTHIHTQKRVHNLIIFKRVFQLQLPNMQIALLSCSHDDCPCCCFADSNILQFIPFLATQHSTLQVNWELVSCSLEKASQHSPFYTCFQRLWSSLIFLLGLGEVGVVIYYLCHHVPPETPPLLALLYCSTRSKARESCCPPIAPFCKTTTCAKLELMIHTNKDKNHKATGLLPDSIATFLKAKPNMLSSILCEAE